MGVDCPKCGCHVMDTSADGTPRLRAKVVLLRASGTVAVCKQCSTEVPVPLVSMSSPKHVVVERLTKRGKGSKLPAVNE